MVYCRLLHSSSSSSSSKIKVRSSSKRNAKLYQDGARVLGSKQMGSRLVGDGHVNFR